MRCKTSGIELRRRTIIRHIQEVAKAAMEYQIQCDHRPVNYGGENKTAIEKAKRHFRKCVRSCMSTMGYQEPPMIELEWMLDFYAKRAPWE